MIIEMIMSGCLAAGLQVGPRTSGLTVTGIAVHAVGDGVKVTGAELSVTKTMSAITTVAAKMVHIAAVGHRDLEEEEHWAITEMAGAEKQNNSIQDSAFRSQRGYGI